jgi:hypothetical protein
MKNYDDDLNELNSLIGDETSFYQRVKMLWKKNPKCFEILPLFLGIRKKDFN